MAADLYVIIRCISRSSVGRLFQTPYFKLIGICLDITSYAPCGLRTMRFGMKIDVSVAEPITFPPLDHVAIALLHGSTAGRSQPLAATFT